MIDVEPAFEARPDPLSLFPFRRFGHYNEAGNQIVAATVLEALASDDRRGPVQTPAPKSELSLRP